MPTGRRRRARSASPGSQLKWREHPYEWIEGSRHVVLRVFEKGVLRWYVAEVQLERTRRRRHEAAQHDPARAARPARARAVEVGDRRQATSASSTRSTAGSIACSRRARAPRSIRSIPRSRCRRRRARASTSARRQLAAAGVDDRATEALVSYLSHASDQDVARIRPVELAHKFGVPEDAMIEACLHAAKLGVLAMVWDVICPSCRIPSSVVDSLAKIEEHGTLQDVQHRLRRRLLARDRARVPRVAGGPRRRDAHVLHRRARALPARRGAGPPAARRAVRAAARARRRLLPRAQPAAAARRTSCASRASGGVRRVDITLGEQRRSAAADRRRSAADARQPDAARGRSCASSAPAIARSR